MKTSLKKKLKPGSKVILTKVPPDLLDNLPREDKKAISAIVGIPIVLERYDEDGRAELNFKDSEGNIHWIWVQPRFIKSAG